LRKFVLDHEPRRFEIDHDVSLGPKQWIVVEQSGGNLEEWRIRIGIRYGRTAPATKGRPIRRRSFANRSFIGPNELLALEKAEIFATNS
jgi:hypothetical protein